MSPQHPDPSTPTQLPRFLVLLLHNSLGRFLVGGTKRAAGSVFVSGGAILSPPTLCIFPHEGLWLAHSTHSRTQPHVFFTWGPASQRRSLPSISVWISEHLDQPNVAWMGPGKWLWLGHCGPVGQASGQNNHWWWKCPPISQWANLAAQLQWRGGWVGEGGAGEAVSSVSTRCSHPKEAICSQSLPRQPSMFSPWAGGDPGWHAAVSDSGGRGSPRPGRLRLAGSEGLGEVSSTSPPFPQEHHWEAGRWSRKSRASERASFRSWRCELLSVKVGCLSVEEPPS